MGYIRIRIPRNAPLPPRKAPIKRGPVKSRRKPRSYAETRGPKEFHAWLHEEPCVARCLLTHCAGPIQAAHFTPKNEKATGRKGHWTFQVPMCMGHHAEWDGHRGQFAGWTPEEREGFRADMVERTRRDWAAYRGES